MVTDAVRVCRDEWGKWQLWVDGQDRSLLHRSHLHSRRIQFHDASPSEKLRVVRRHALKESAFAYLHAIDKTKHQILVYLRRDGNDTCNDPTCLGKVPLWARRADYIEVKIVRRLACQLQQLIRTYDLIFPNTPLDPTHHEDVLDRRKDAWREVMNFARYYV